MLKNFHLIIGFLMDFVNNFVTLIKKKVKLIKFHLNTQFYWMLDLSQNNKLLLKCTMLWIIITKLEECVDI